MPLPLWFYICHCHHHFEGTKAQAHVSLSAGPCFFPPINSAVNRLISSMNIIEWNFLFVWHGLYFLSGTKYELEVSAELFCFHGVEPTPVLFNPSMIPLMFLIMGVCRTTLLKKTFSSTEGIPTFTYLPMAGGFAVIQWCRYLPWKWRYLQPSGKCLRCFILLELSSNPLEKDSTVQTSTQFTSDMHIPTATLTRFSAPSLSALKIIQRALWNQNDWCISARAVSQAETEERISRSHNST